MIWDDKKEGFVNNLQLIDTLRCAKTPFLRILPYHRLQYLKDTLLNYIKLKNKEARKLNITIKAHDAIGDVLVFLKTIFISRLVASCRELYPTFKILCKN